MYTFFEAAADSGDAGGSIIGGIISVALTVLGIIAMWNIFTKAGEAGWKSLIPILNTYTMFKIVYGNGWKFLLLLVPILGEILAIVYLVRLGQVFGKGVGFILGLIFLAPIFIILLGFGKDQYQGPMTDKFI
ncbi:MAG: hypothetical protein II714_03705 [Oscillospiraceae bacterium]|jgi:hypothetical protein|nr:hypothetical protein [Oscillospiraceae bacterium]